MSSRELAAVLLEVKGKHVSNTTIKRRLHEIGLKGYKARKKPSEKNKKTRLKCALNHQNWTVEDWSNVLWCAMKVTSRYNNSFFT